MREREKDGALFLVMGYLWIIEEGESLTVFSFPACPTTLDPTLPHVLHDRRGHG
jgi:hypothetical protein